MRNSNDIVMRNNNDHLLKFNEELLKFIKKDVGVFEYRLLVGWSPIIIKGALIKARAIATCFCWPADNIDAGLSALSLSPSKRNF